MHIDTTTYKDRIIQEYADLECKKISRKIIDRLRKMDSVVCNERFDDSQCETVWNAVCVRAYEGDVSEPYEDYAYTIFVELAKSIPEYVKSAIWCDCIEKDFSAFDEDDIEYEREVQNFPDGSEHVISEEIVDIKGFPYVLEDVFRYIWNYYVISAAEKYSNKVIRNEIDMRDNRCD